MPVASASVAASPLPLGPSQYGPPANVFTATTSLTNRGDSGGNGDWAIDTITRTLTIRETGHPGSTYTYTATVSDTGTFERIPHAYTPNQGAPNTGKKIKGTLQGTITGNANYYFTATSLPNSGRNLGVPSRESGTPASGTPQTTSLWYEQAFPANTTGGSGIGTWIWTYHSGSGGFTQDNGKGNGGGRDNGNDWSSGFGQGQGNSCGNGGPGGGPSCRCGSDHGRSQGYGSQKNCPQGQYDQGQGSEQRGGQDGNKGGGGKSGSQGPSKSSAEKWVDSSSNGDGQLPADGNITGS